MVQEKAPRRALKKVVRGGKALAQFQKVRFVVVGAMNTVLDFAILNLLVGVFHAPLIPANIASTTISLVFSFTLNKKAVFRGGSGATPKQFVLFVVVTLIGIWVIQNLIMVNVYAWLESALQAHQDTSWLNWLLLNAAKAAATLFSAVWNYLWYSRVVFRQKEQK